MKTRLSLKEWERLSAYLDGQLGERERRQVEEWLRTRPEVREAWHSLRQTRHVLRHAPRHRVPRNFTLTPAMAGAPAPKPRPLFIWQLAPALAVFLVIVAVLIEFLPIGSTGPTAHPLLSAAQPEAMSAAQPTATAVVVYWGGPPSPAIGMGGGGAEGFGGMGGGAGDTSTPFKGYAPETTPPAPPSQLTPTPAPLLATPQPTPEVRALTVPSPQALNPVLGLPAPEERGKIYIVTPTPTPERESPLVFPTSFKRLLQGGLIGLAFILGMVVLIRRLRSQ